MEKQYNLYKPSTSKLPNFAIFCYNWIVNTVYMNVLLEDNIIVPNNDVCKRSIDILISLESQYIIHNMYVHKSSTCQIKNTVST